MPGAMLALGEAARRRNGLSTIHAHGEVVTFARWSVLASVFAVALATREAKAGNPIVVSDGDDRADAFRYTTPYPKDYFRAVLEGVGVLGIGFLEYLVSTKPSRSGISPPYDWSIFHDKLGGNAQSFDINHFNTNFIGHPLGGSLYYLSARSNRLGLLPSFGWAFTGSLVWEMLGEITEKPSYNDMIVTPWAGLSNGEVLTQLGGFFARGRPNVANGILQAFFCAPRFIHDRLDGLAAEPSPTFDELGFPTDVWHRFDVSLGVGATWQQGTPSAGFDQRLHLDAEVINLPDYAAVGRHSRSFSDGNLARLRFDLGLSNGRLVDARFSTQSTLAGYYARSASLDRSGRVRGDGAIAGVYVGFEYGVHDFDRDRARTLDQTAKVTVLGVSGEYRRDSGPFRLRARAQLGADFVGAHAYALGAYATLRAPNDLPAVLRKEGYYFGAGPSLSTSLELGVYGLDLTGEIVVEDWHAILGLDDDESKLTHDVPRSDRRVRYRASLGYLFRVPHVRVAAEATSFVRSGTVGDTADSRRENTITFSIGATL